MCLFKLPRVRYTKEVKDLRYVFSSNNDHYNLLAYLYFICSYHSRVNFTPSMLSGNVLEWSNNTPEVKKSFHSSVYF